jgi:putative ABC transport system permease protein
MGILLQDIRYGLRTLRKAPSFTAVAVISLALGIGVNTAIFSVVNALLIASLPYHDPDRLILAWGDSIDDGHSLEARYLRPTLPIGVRRIAPLKT